MKQVIRLLAVVGLGMGLGVSPVRADTFEWSPGSQSALWSAGASSWTRTSGSSRTYPNATNDIAMFVRDLGGNEYTNTSVLGATSGNSYTVGRIVFSPKPYSYTKITVGSGYLLTNTLVMKDSSGTATIEFTNQASEAKFGNRYNGGVLRLDLQNDLLFTHALAGASGVTVGFASDSTADTSQFMTSAGKRNIILRPTGTAPLRVNSYSSINTNSSTWYVDGTNTVLAIKSDGGLGRTNNEVVLQNGGVLDANAITAGWAPTNRTISGVGTLNSTNRTLTWGPGCVLVPGGTNAVGMLSVGASNLTMDAASRVKLELAGDTSADALAVALRSGTSLTLGGTLEVSLIGDYLPATARTSWTLLSATGGTIQGGFAQTNLPSAWYTLSVTSTNISLAYTPPSGTFVFIR